MKMRWRQLWRQRDAEAGNWERKTESQGKSEAETLERALHGAAGCRLGALVLAPGAFAPSGAWDGAGGRAGARF